LEVPTRETGTPNLQRNKKKALSKESNQ
jgi:hypothetical protein